MTNTVVSSGETSSGIVLNSGDTMEVLSGGTAIDTTVNSGGTLQLFDGAIVNGVTINSGGLVNHLSGATTVSGGTIVNSGTIDAEAPSGSLLIEPDNFTNSDLIQVRNGDHVMLLAQISNEDQFLAGKDLAGRVMGRVDHDCPCARVKSRF